MAAILRGGGDHSGSRS